MLWFTVSEVDPVVQRCCQAVVWRWRDGITIRRRRVVNCLPRLDLQGGGNTSIHPTSALPSFMSDLVNIWTGIPHSFSRTQYCALERLYSKSLPRKTSPWANLGSVPYICLRLDQYEHLPQTFDHTLKGTVSHHGGRLVRAVKCSTEFPKTQHR